MTFKSSLCLNGNFCDTRGSLKVENGWLIMWLREVFGTRQHRVPSHQCQEFAGNACALSTPAHLPDCWIADTGATSHMTPHREWFKTYKPCKVPVRLADNNVIYAAGVGSIVFTPIVDGVPLRQLEFSDVLHVPLLANNLLSVLTLTKKKNFEVNIRKATMSFMLNSQVLFQASVSNDNTALLDGATVVQAALRTTAFSPDLWHHRFCHIG